MVNKLKRREFFIGWLFIAVPFIGTIIFSFVPTIMSFYLSFTEWTGFTTIDNAKWVGLKNFKSLFGILYGKDFGKALLNTLYLMLQLPISLFLSLLLAVALNRKLPLAGAFRVIYYIPGLTMGVVVVLIFQNLFAADGVISSIFAVFGTEKFSWLDKPGYAPWVIILLSVWKNIGGNFLLFLASLQSIGHDYYEAARLDGANPRKMFFKITVPLLQPMIFFMLIMGIMGGFQAFSEPYLMFPYNDGYGPQSSTMTVMVMMYYQYGKNKLGLASAISWVLALIIFAITLFQFWYNRRVNKDVA